MAYASVVDVMLVLTRDDHVLLALRQGTGYADGLWNVPSGKLEDGEHALDAVIREAKEEIGITLQPDDLQLTGVVHCRNPEGEGRIGLFFATPYRPHQHGEPHNAEPHKCAALAWYPLSEPPPDTVPYTTAGLHLANSNAVFATHGWADGHTAWASTDVTS